MNRAHTDTAITNTIASTFTVDGAAAALPSVTQFRCTSAAVNELSCVGTYFFSRCGVGACCAMSVGRWMSLCVCVCVR